jgi:hypothetical protein
MKKKAPVPTEEQIKKDLRKIHGKIKTHKGFHLSIFIRVAIGILLGIILLLIFTSPVLWNDVAEIKNDTEYKRTFFFSSCSTYDLSSCTFEIYGNEAVFNYSSKSYVLEEANLELCKEINVSSDHIFFSDCTFSSVSNKGFIDLTYTSPVSGLEHTSRAKIQKVIDMTKFHALSLDVFDKATFRLFNLTQN